MSGGVALFSPHKVKRICHCFVVFGEAVPNAVQALRLTAMNLVSSAGVVPNLSSSERITVDDFHCGISKKFDELTKSGDRLGKTLTFERREQFCSRLGWIAKSFSLAFDCSAYHSWCHVEKRQQEVVRVLGFDVERGEHFSGKVLPVIGHDDFGTPAYGSGQDMAVVWIG